MRLFVASLFLVIACGPSTTPTAATVPAAPAATPAPAAAASTEDPEAATADACASERAALEETASSHAALATCEEKAGHLIPALKSSQKALGLAMQERDMEGMRTGRV